MLAVELYYLPQNLSQGHFCDLGGSSFLFADGAARPSHQ